MKLALAYVGILIVAVEAAVAIGYRPTVNTWGPTGLRSMWAAAGACLIGAVVAACPAALLASRRSPQTGLVCLAGTGVRLALTGGFAIAYQLFAEVHLRSFLAWLAVLYLLLLVIETMGGVLLVRRAMPVNKPGPG